MPRRAEGRMTGEPVTTEIPQPAGGVKLVTFIPWTLVKRGMKKEIITPIDAPEAFTVEAAEERQKKKTEQPSPVVRALRSSPLRDLILAPVAQYLFLQSMTYMRETAQTGKPVLCHAMPLWQWLKGHACDIVATCIRGSQSRVGAATFSSLRAIEPRPGLFDKKWSPILGDSISFSPRILTL